MLKEEHITHPTPGRIPSHDLQAILPGRQWRTRDRGLQLRHHPWRRAELALQTALRNQSQLLFLPGHFRHPAHPPSLWKTWKKAASVMVNRALARALGQTRQNLPGESSQMLGLPPLPNDMPLVLSALSGSEARVHERSITLSLDGLAQRATMYCWTPSRQRRCPAGAHRRALRHHRRTRSRGPLATGKTGGRARQRDHVRLPGQHEP